MWWEPAYKAYKVCHFVGPKKRKVTTVVCVVKRRKAPTKNDKIRLGYQKLNIWLPDISNRYEVLRNQLTIISGLHNNV